MTKHRIRKHTGDYHAWLIDSLKNQQEAAAYLQTALLEYQRDNHLPAFLMALRDVVEAHGGMAQLAQKARLNRESLYRTLSSRGNPRLQTIGALLQSLGLELVIQPAR